MKVTPIQLGLEEVIGSNGPDFHRTPGLHWSDISGPLYQELEPKRYLKGSKPDPLTIGAGLLWENVLEEALRNKIGADSRPGELVDPTHGIIYSPDLILFNGVTRIGEIKLTWMSSREWPRESTHGLPPKADKYVHQMANYCYWFDTPYARLITFFVNGAYHKYGRMGPEVLAWDLEFSARELKEKMQETINFAKKAGLL